MIFHFIKAFWRNLLRNGLTSIVIISGLSIAIACVVLISQFIKDEFSFDKFHRNKDKIYRLISTTSDSSGQQTFAGNTGHPYGPVFSTAFPEIESFCRLETYPLIVKKGIEGINTSVLYADSTFFDFFSFKPLYGHAHHMLKERFTTVLSEKAAKKFFGQDDPIGKAIEIKWGNGFEPFLVTGVVKDPPSNSSIQFDILVPYQMRIPQDSAAQVEKDNNWTSITLTTFFKLKSAKENISRLQQKITQFYQKADKAGTKRLDEIHSSITFSLQPMTSIHLDGRFKSSYGVSNVSKSSRSYILSGLLFVIIAVALANFISLMLARSSVRNKEISMRRITGSSRKLLMIQFLFEAFLVTVISFVVSAFLISFMLPFFNTISGKQFDISFIFRPNEMPFYFATLLGISVMAGLYPAMIASGFKPIDTLYGKFRLTGNNLFGKSLIVLQFSITTGLVICVFIFQKQFDLMTKDGLRYDYKNTLRLDYLFWNEPDKLQRLKQELNNHPAIESVTMRFGDGNSTKLKIGDRKTDNVSNFTIDDNYFKTFRIPLSSGRYLSYQNPVDTLSGIMVNEAFIEEYIDKSVYPIGQTVTELYEDSKQLTIVGVIKNYHVESFREKVKPELYRLDKRGRTINIFIRYKQGNAIEAADALTTHYKSILPFTPLSYTFMEDWNQRFYEDDIRWKKIFTSSAIIAIIISCLGLFSLVTFSIEQRTRELGIRKILGAKVSVLVLLTTKNFFKLILLSAIIISPVAWWVMNKWLESFAYRVKLSWWLFAVSVLFALFMAMLSTIFQVLKAAMMNPVKSLKRNG